MGEIIDFASRSREIRSQNCKNCKWNIPHLGACTHPDGGSWELMKLYIKTGGYCPLWKSRGKDKLI